MDNPKFIPTTEALREVARDLRFHPSKVEHPQRLSAAEIEGFNRDGYLAGIQVFGRNEIADIRGYFDQLLRVRWPRAATAIRSVRRTFAMAAFTIC